jgi:membrane-associated PAP2 superfamily phosphatase
LTRLRSPIAWLLATKRGKNGPKWIADARVATTGAPNGKSGLRALRSPAQVPFWLLLGLAVVLAFDATGWDMPLALAMNGYKGYNEAAGFPLRDYYLLTHWYYEYPKKLAILIILALAVMIWRAPFSFGQLSRAERAWVLVQVLLVALLIPSIKQFSTSACPWDLEDFGDAIPYISHWDFSQSTWFNGGCFPAGHAVTGYAFIPVAYALWRVNPRASYFLAALILSCGTMFGIAQQLRGAHFMSHTLWSAWLCCAFAYALSRIEMASLLQRVFQRLRQR